MRTYTLALFLALAPTVAWAQQPKQMLPSQMAIAIDRAVGEMASAAEGLQSENADLKLQVEKLTKELADKTHPPVLHNHNPGPVPAPGGEPNAQQVPAPSPPDGGGSTQP